ncbi:MAG TPA: ferrochelatase [Vicinamibacterales bacterium]|nr:ferrochelatase [Vicinamibacterales bacterium]
MSAPFDAVLLVAFGGPQGPADVRPFLENVLRGRRVSPERIEEVAHHYERFRGVSPLTELTLAQARALEGVLRQRGLPLPVHVGMRNWHPYLAETLADMSRHGVRRAIGILAAAQRTYSGCLQYRENVRDARAALARAGLPDVEVVYIGDWHEHPGFVQANVDHVRQAFERLPADRRGRARLVFTAHSIPVSMAQQYPYEQQLRASASLIAQALGIPDPHDPRTPRPGSSDLREPRPWALVYQSRSGRPGDPWLEPDICDYLEAEAAAGLDTAVLCPVGFLCDHVEVLYDLDVEAADTCNELGLVMQRAQAVNLHPRFIDALADGVAATWQRYDGTRPLTVTSGQ